MSALVVDNGKDQTVMLISDSLSDFVCSDLSDEHEIVITSDGVSSCGDPSDRTKPSSSTFVHIHPFVFESVDGMVEEAEQHPMDGVGVEVSVKSPVEVKSVEIKNGECLCLAL